MEGVTAKARPTSPGKADYGASSGRKGSVLGEQYLSGARYAKDGQPLPEHVPTNEEVAKEVQRKVAAAVEMSRKYRHVAWYTLFVAAYMAVLYLQANAYKAGEVVSTLKAQFANSNGDTSFTFQNEDQVLQYLGEQVLQPIWKDPICGDGTCEYPWEFPAWGRFGCFTDCGTNDNVTAIVVNVQADFTAHPSISARVLMNNAAWNLCLKDDMRRSRGEADLCWYAEDQQFSAVVVNSISSMSVVDGLWYVQVTGDYAGRVSGRVFDITNDTQPVEMTTTPAWTSCKLPTTKSATAATQTALRRLLQAYTAAHQTGSEEGQAIIQQAIQDVQAIPELCHINFTRITEAATSVAQIKGTGRTS